MFLHNWYRSFSHVLDAPYDIAVFRFANNRKGNRDQREHESTHGSQCWLPHRQRPSFPYNYSISSCAYSYVVAASRAESMVENGRYWNATYDRVGETRRRGTARSFQDIEEMNGIGCWAKLHSDNYLLAALSLASFSILKNNACHPIVRIITEIFRPMDKTWFQILTRYSYM